MEQMTLADMEYANRRKKTRREEFLEAMDADHTVETTVRNDQTALFYEQNGASATRN